MPHSNTYTHTSVNINDGVGLQQTSITDDEESAPSHSPEDVSFPFEIEYMMNDCSEVMWWLNSPITIIEVCFSLIHSFIFLALLYVNK